MSLVLHLPLSTPNKKLKVISEVEEIANHAAVHKYDIPESMRHWRKKKREAQ